VWFNGIVQLFARMLPYVHESPVGDVLVHFLGFVQFSPHDREQVWNWMERENVLLRILEVARISGSGARQVFDAVCRVLDRVAMLPQAQRVAKIV
jgi:hypothetical protein